MAQQGRLKVGIPPESTIKSHEVQIGRTGERSQIGIRPNFGRKIFVGGKTSPVRLDIERLVKEFDPRILLERVVGLPCLGERNDVVAHCLAIRRNTQKSLLRRATEADRSRAICLEPNTGRLVMRMSVESQRNPDVNVRQIVLHLQESRQSVDWTGLASQDSWNETTGIGLCLSGCPGAQIRVPRQQPQHPRAAHRDPQAQFSRSVFVRVVSFLDRSSLAD